jgi:hypothetical protein
VLPSQLPEFHVGSKSRVAGWLPLTVASAIAITSLIGNAVLMSTVIKQRSEIKVLQAKLQPKQKAEGRTPAQTPEQADTEPTRPER